LNQTLKIVICYIVEKKKEKKILLHIFFVKMKLGDLVIVISVFFVSRDLLPLSAVQS
jgi:hypothetical protein